MYVELIQKLPRIVAAHGRIRLDDILCPSYSSLVDLNAAPIHRSLGIGANWLIRELSRNRVYTPSDTKLMAPYCWAPSRRVRRLLRKLDPNLHLKADKDVSPIVHDFVKQHLDAERALFDGDFDLPLQLITRGQHRERLNGWFVDAGLEAPEFGDEPEDNED